MKWDDFSQLIRIKAASSMLSEVDWREIYEIFVIRIMSILGAALVIVLFIQFMDTTSAREDRTIYKNIGTVNPCGPAAYAPITFNASPPCVRTAGFFDKFSKLFLVVMVFIISICLLSNLPVYDKDNPKSRQTDIYFFVPLSRSEAVLIIIACWLLGLPLNYFLLNIPFLEYTQLWLFLAVSGYTGSYVLLVLYFVMKKLGNRTDRAFSPFNVTLSNLDANQVIVLMGKPLKIINIESKMIYVYKNVKVIFTEGKVSDVR